MSQHPSSPLRQNDTEDPEPAFKRRRIDPASSENDDTIAPIPSALPQEEDIASVRNYFEVGTFAEQEVLSATGYMIRRDQVKVGDVLCAPDGSPRRVLRVETRPGDLYRLVPAKGTPFLVHSGQRLVMRLAFGAMVLATVKGKSFWLKHYWDATAARIVSRVYVKEVYPLREDADTAWSATKNAHAPNWKDTESFELTPLQWFNVAKSMRKCLTLLSSAGLTAWPKNTEQRLPPRLLGIWLGDGCRGKTSIFMTREKKAELLDYLRDETKYTLTTPLSRPIAHHLSGAIPDFNAHGLLDGDKFVPHCFEYTNITDLSELLAGLIDTDGSLCWDKVTFDWIQKRENLTKSLLFCARAIGLRALHTYVHVKWTGLAGAHTPGGAGWYHRVLISGHTNKVPTLVSTKKPRPSTDKRSVLTTTFTLEDVGKEDYIDFGVEGDNRYLSGDFRILAGTEHI
jgi:type IV secretion system protein VirB4